MLSLHFLKWPLWYKNAHEPAHLPGGVAPLRGDLLLARYLEKQATRRASTLGRTSSLGRAIRSIMPTRYQKKKVAASVPQVEH
jgi:hypothetical protein